MSPQQPPPHRGRPLPPQQHPGQPYPVHYPPQQYPPYPPQGYPPQQHPGYHPSAETRRDVTAAWSARLELGADFEAEIAENLAEQVERLAEQRLEVLQSQQNAAARTVDAEQAGRNRQLALGIVSAGVGVPITAIALNTDPGLAGLIVSWLGIVGINAIHAVSLIRRRRP